MKMRAFIYIVSLRFICPLCIYNCEVDGFVYVLKMCFHICFIGAQNPKQGPFLLSIFGRLYLKTLKSSNSSNKKNVVAAAFGEDRVNYESPRDGDVQQYGHFSNQSFIIFIWFLSKSTQHLLSPLT